MYTNLTASLHINEIVSREPCTSRKGTNWTISRDAMRPLVLSSLSPLSPSKTYIFIKEAGPLFTFQDISKKREWQEHHHNRTNNTDGGSFSCTLYYLHLLEVCSSNSNNKDWQWKIRRLHNGILCFLEICDYTILQNIWKLVILQVATVPYTMEILWYNTCDQAIAC